MNICNVRVTTKNKFGKDIKSHALMLTWLTAREEAIWEPVGEFHFASPWGFLHFP